LKRYVVTVALSTDLKKVVALRKQHGPAFLHGKLTYPGGNQEPGESAAEAGARELGEEAGLQVAAGDLVQATYQSVPGAYELTMFAVRVSNIDAAQTLTDEEVTVLDVATLRREFDATPEGFAPDIVAFLDLAISALGQPA